MASVDAAAGFLRVAASTHLPIEGVIRAEQLGIDEADRILALLADDADDAAETPGFDYRPVQTVESQVAPVSGGRTSEHGQADQAAVGEMEAEELSGAVGPVDLDSLVSFEESPFDDEPSYISYTDDGVEEPEERTPVYTESASAGLISYGGQKDQDVVAFEEEEDSEDPPSEMPDMSLSGSDSSAFVSYGDEEDSLVSGLADDDEETMIDLPTDVRRFVSFEEGKPVISDEGGSPDAEEASSERATLVDIGEDEDEGDDDDEMEPLISLEEDEDGILDIDIGGIFDEDEVETGRQPLMVRVQTSGELDVLPGILDDGPPSDAFDEEEVTFVAGAKELEALRQEQSAASGPAAVTAGLYGSPAVPTIREGTEARPPAAAIQINQAAGTGKVMALEEDIAPIEIGDVGDYGEDEDEYEYEDDDEDEDGGGFRIAAQEYDEEEEEEEDDEEEEEPPMPQIDEPEPDYSGETKRLFEAAKAASENGDMQEGTDLFSDVIDLDPDHMEAHVGRGRLYLDLGDYTRAMSDFMVAEEIEPDDPEPQIAIGDLYFARKDYRKAITYFNAALAMEPNHAMAFCRRGISHYYRRNYPQAMQDLVRAKKLDGGIPNIDTYIGMAKKKAKR
jgi:tetratricopeptide (TPR) repeat protein